MALVDRPVPSTGSQNHLDQLGNLEDRVHVQGAVRLGAGSLGLVLLVQDRRGGPPVAVKVISLPFVRESGQDEARVWREVQVMQEIAHPNVVRLLDVLTTKNRLPHVSAEPPYLCIVMEYVAESEPLSNLLRRAGPSAALARQVLPQLAGALSLMHRRGWVHRDVWSENVLVDCRGRAVLVDLGCAEYTGSGSRPAVNSKLNIPYMSPESAQGLQQSPGDDSWGLGLLLTEIITGRFVADRLGGRSDVPIHFQQPALKEALQETQARACQLLGKVVVQLLEPNARRRFSMEDVLACCSHAMKAPSCTSAPATSMVPSKLPSYAPPLGTTLPSVSQAPDAHRMVPPAKPLCVELGHKKMASSANTSRTSGSVTTGHLAAGSRVPAHGSSAPVKMATMARPNSLATITTGHSLARGSNVTTSM